MAGEKRILAAEVICPRCGSEVALTNKQQIEGQFVCPSCRCRIHCDKDEITSKIIPWELLQQILKQFDSGSGK